MSADDAGRRRLHATVRGVVQGVGFRAAVEFEARKLDLSGWVRNRADGSVELDAEGDAAVFATFVAFLRKGPRGAHVISVSEEWLPPSGATPSPFEVRRTE